MSPNEGGGGCGVSANENICAHGAQINFGDLTPYLTYGPAVYQAIVVDDATASVKKNIFRLMTIPDDAELLLVQSAIKFS
jgi:hypothetical protein